MNDLPFAKRRRVRSRRAIEEYAASHPRCELFGCHYTPMPQPHHLVSQRMGGDDAPSNLLRLCWLHHIGPLGWHRLGRETWYARFRHLLTREADAKVRKVLGYEDPAA